MRSHLIWNRQTPWAVISSSLLIGLCFLVLPGTAITQTPGNVMFQPQLGAQRILIIRVVYPDDTTSLLSDEKAIQHTATAKAIMSANSYGQLELEFDITPVLMMPQLSTFYMLENRLSFVRLRADALKLAAEAGYPESAYDKEGIYTRKIWPQPFNGIGGVNRKTFYMANTNPSIMIHEIGHLYDFRHSNFWRVTSNNPLDPDGELIEYGDKFSQMGDFANPHHFNPWNKTRVGWIPRKNIKTVTESGNYIVQALENTPQQDSIVGAFSALRIRRKPGEEFWVYYRSQEDSANVGALIMLTEPRNSAPSILLDMNPGSRPRLQDHIDAALQVGRTVSDTEGGIQITVLIKNADSLAVNVVMPETPVERLPAINIISPEFTKGINSGLIHYEVTAFDPDVAAENGAGIDSVLLILGYPEGDDPFGEGTEFITKATKVLTAPPYIMEIDSDTLPDESYRLQIGAKTNSGKANLAVFNHIIDNTGPSTLTAVQNVAEPDQLLKCYPNPFGNRITIEYQNPSHNALVDLSIYNTWSQKVASLVHAQMPQGTHTVQWDINMNSPLANGLYLCRLTIDGKTYTYKLLSQN